ncbi:hypothetical protein Ddc_16337 [Ditylenchus destructor]|nr:hypothetical protein Ddc_16337 [Ditylenchus destructor]
MLTIKCTLALPLVVFLTYLFLANAAHKKKSFSFNYGEYLNKVVCNTRGEGEISALDFTRTPSPGVMSLSNLNSVHRGQGIGNALVKYFIKVVVKAEEYNKVTLTVANGGGSDIAAAKVYEKYNFICYGFSTTKLIVLVRKNAKGACKQG